MGAIIGDMIDNSPAGPSSDGTQVSFMSGAGYFGPCLSHAPLVAGQQPLSPKDLVARVRTRGWMPGAEGKVFKLAALRNKAMVQSLSPLQQGDSREGWGPERCIVLINIHRGVFQYSTWPQLRGGGTDCCDPHVGGHEYCLHGGFVATRRFLTTSRAE